MILYFYKKKCHHFWNLLLNSWKNCKGRTKTFQYVALEKVKRVWNSLNDGDYCLSCITSFGPTCPAVLGFYCQYKKVTQSNGHVRVSRQNLQFYQIKVKIHSLPLEFTAVSQTEREQQSPVYTYPNGIQVPVPARLWRHGCYSLPAWLKESTGGNTMFTDTTTDNSNSSEDIYRNVKMPKLLFSKMRFNEIRDKMKNLKRPGR